MEKVYQMVTDRIIEQMNKGIIPWHKPWQQERQRRRSVISSTERKQNN